MFGELENELQRLAGQLDSFGKIREAIGNALTQNQRSAISKIVLADKKAFFFWINSPNGRSMVRTVADSFLHHQESLEKDKGDNE